MAKAHMHTSSIAADDENGLCGNSSEKQQSQWLNGLFLYHLFAQTDSGLFFFCHHNALFSDSVFLRLFC